MNIYIENDETIKYYLIHLQICHLQICRFVVL